MEHHRTKYILPALLLILLLGYVFIRFTPADDVKVATVPVALPDRETIRSDMGEVKTIPEGFPVVIPVGQDLVESYKTTDRSMHMTEYTVSFRTKSKSVISSYQSFFAVAGFAVSTTTTDYLEGKKNAETLKISTTSSVEDKTLVTVSLRTS